MERRGKAQWNVFTLAQLREIGLSEQQVRTMVQRRQLHRRHHGVYSYGHPQIPWQGVYLAAQFACGPDAYLTGHAALAALGLRRPYLGRVELTVPGRAGQMKQHPQDRPRLEIHRTTIPPHPDELRTLGPLRYASLPLVLAEFAERGASEKQLSDLITQAIRAGKLDHAHMQTLLTRRQGRSGVKTLRSAYAYYATRKTPKSTLEDSFDEAIAARPNIPEPQRNIHLNAGGIDWEIDRYFPDEGVVVELDHRQYHDAKLDRERDNIKDHKLAATGRVVMRISEQRWTHDREAALDDLEELLQARKGWGRSAPPPQPR